MYSDAASLYGGQLRFTVVKGVAAVFGQLKVETGTIFVEGFLSVMERTDLESSLLWLLHSMSPASNAPILSFRNEVPRRGLAPLDFEVSYLIVPSNGKTCLDKSSRAGR